MTGSPGSRSVTTAANRPLPLRLVTDVARPLASVAGAGELLASQSAYAAARMDGPAERRELELKGVTAPITVRVLNSSAAPHSD